MKIRDIFGRVTSAFKSRKPTTAAKSKADDPNAFKRQAEDVNRYIWQNPGLNRYERRSLAAKIRSKRFHKRDGRLNDAERKVAKFSLKNTVKNFPGATRALLKKNIGRLRKGEPILIYRGN